MLQAGAAASGWCFSRVLQLAAAVLQAGAQASASVLLLLPRVRVRVVHATKHAQGGYHASLLALSRS